MEILDSKQKKIISKNADLYPQKRFDYLTSSVMIQMSLCEIKSVLITFDQH